MPPIPRRSSTPLAALASCSLVLFCGTFGCSGDDGDRVEVYPASGKVTFNGKPVADASVSFSPKEGQPVAYATTNADGEFTLTTYETGDGAAAGSYTVLVTKTESEPAPAGGHGASGGHSASSPVRGHGPGGEQIKSEIPLKYSRGNESDLTATVTPDGENKFTLDLKP